MPDGCGAETTKTGTSGFRAFVGKTSMDFGLSALRFIVAVSSFFGLNVRVFMRAPRIPQPWRLKRNCMGVEFKLHYIADETTDCCSIETRFVLSTQGTPSIGRALGLPEPEGRSTSPPVQTGGLPLRWPSLPLKLRHCFKLECGRGDRYSEVVQCDKGLRIYTARTMAAKTYSCTFRP